MAGWVGPAGAGGTDNNSGGGTSIVGTTGVTCSMSSVTAGQLIVIGDIITIPSALTPTITDTSSNVTSWTSSKTNNANGNCNMVVAWGFATSSGACNPKVTWNTASSGFQDLYAGAFTTPGGTITQDGTITQANGIDNGGSVATVILPAGGGTGQNDLVINLVSFTGGFASLTGGWVLLGPNIGNGNAYKINAAGNSTPNVTQSPSSQWMSIVVALQASGLGAAVTPRRMPLGL